MSSETVNIKKILKLARLSEQQENTEQLAEDFGNILGYIEKLSEVKVEGVAPLAHVHDSNNVFREDIAFNSLTPEEALQNAPDRSGNYIRVPLVIEDAE